MRKGFTPLEVFKLVVEQNTFIQIPSNRRNLVASSRSSRRHRDDLPLTGFTLLEILVALMILAIGLASVFALFGAGTSSYRRSVNDTTIARMATTILAEIETSMQNPGGPPAGEARPNGGRNIPLRDATNKTHPDFPAIYTYDLTLTPITDSANDSVFVTLTIKWKQPKGFGSEKFETIIRTKTTDTRR